MLDLKLDCYFNLFLNMFNKRLLDLYEPIEISGSFTDMIICHIEQLDVIYNKRIFN